MSKLTREAKLIERSTRRLLERGIAAAVLGDMHVRTTSGFSIERNLKLLAQECERVKTATKKK